MPETRKQDKFWKLYLGIVGIFTFLILIVYFTLFLTKNPDTSVPGQVLGSNDAALREYPFIETPKIYTDILTHGWEDWSWDSKVNFGISMGEGHGGSISVEYKKPYGGLMLHAPHFDTQKYNSIVLSVYPENASSSLFIEITNDKGKVIGSQLLSWYLPGKVFKANEWQRIVVPLINLRATSTIVTGISIVSANPDRVYVDDIEWSSENPFFPIWVEGQDNQKFDRISPINLNNERGESTPFVSDFYFKNAIWQTLAGDMKMEYAKLKLAATSTNYAAVSLRGGDFWANYRYTVFLDWGTGDSVNLITRRADDENYFSCSFYDDGANVTLYQISKGKQIELDSAPNFTRTRVYSWSKTKSLGVEVKADTVSCLVDGDIKLTHVAKSPSPQIGGVGLELWSPKAGQSAVSINKVTVEAIK